MKILYGVVGEGMGHATRSRVALEHLHKLGHEILIVVSGRAHGFLTRAFAGRPRITIKEIIGMHLVYEENSVDRSASLWSNLKLAPQSLRQNLNVRREVLDGFEADVVISDFESWAYFFARTENIPVISIDNMQVINRCTHPAEITRGFDYHLAKLAVKAKLPGAWHYLVTSFFFPPVRKLRTTLIPPILRPEILAAKREPGQHILVYQTSSASTRMIPLLKTLPYEFRIYGMNKEGQDGNITLRAFSETGFIDDLRTARAVMAGGGYSLMGEAVHLHVPMLSVPIESQYEQVLNALYLQELGYGRYASELDADAIQAFLEGLDTHQNAVNKWPQYDQSMLYGCLEELLADVVAGGEPKPFLNTRALGTWEGEP